MWFDLNMFTRLGLLNFRRIARAQLLILWLSATNAAHASAPEKGWILKQKTGMMGEHTLYVSSKGIRVDSKETDYVILLKPPAWRVILFNRKTKTVYEVDADLWQGRLAFGVAGLASAGRFDGLSRRDAGVCQDSGVKARRILMMSTHPTVVIRSDGTKQLDGQLVRSCEYFVAADMPIPAKAAHVVQRFYKIPLADGIPLHLTFVNEYGGRKPELETRECRTEVLPASIFANPEGYQRVKRDSDVALDSANQGLLEEMAK
jgi:hypothetical protein